MHARTTAPDIRLTINGRSHSAWSGETLLTVLQRAGIHLPTLCAEPRLSCGGHCRLCSVEIGDQPHPITSCNTPALAGLCVITHSPELQQFRRQLLEWLAERCSVWDLQHFPEKPLHRALVEYGITPRLTPEDDHHHQVDDSHPLIRVDMSRCISCFRCVSVCDHLQGQSVWHVLGRDQDLRIVPDSGQGLGDSTCTGCGACVDACPTTALLDRSLHEAMSASPTGTPATLQNTRTVCGYCAVGCELNVLTDADRIVSIRGVDTAAVNRGHLCAKGHYAHEFVRSPQRITRPLLKQQGQWQDSTWPEALQFTARSLRRLVETHGPDSIGVLASARATNEEGYLAQKFARLVIGTHNIDCCARVCHTPTAAAMKTMLGTGAATNSFDDIEHTQCFLVVGANPLENHPVVGARIRQQLLRGAAKAIVIDPRRTGLATLAQVHLAPRPGTDIPLLHAMAQVIISEQLHDADYVATRIDNFPAFHEKVNAWTPERAAEVCGIPAQSIRDAARLYARSKPAMCLHGLGITEHTQGTETVMCVVNLALLCGQLGKTGAGVNPLRGQNNVQGAAHMGCDRGILTGSLSVEAGRERFEQAWHAPLPTRRGLSLLEMMDAAAEGRLKALYIMGYDIYLTLANSAATRKALQQLELVIVQDLFMNATAEHFGTVFLPAAACLEKDGTFMNSERRVQRLRQCVPPPGEARTDWQILGELARAMGSDQCSFDSAEAIWEEIRSVWPDGAGISYARLEQGGLQWPCTSERDPGTSILHVDGFSGQSHTSLQWVDYTPTREIVDASYPFLLTTGRTLHQFNAGTMTAHSSIHVLRPTDTLDMAPDDAQRLGLNTTDTVRVTSRHGEAQLTLRVDAGVQPGQLFATFHDAGVFLNQLTSPYRDKRVHTPEYKVTAVQVNKR